MEEGLGLVSKLHLDAEVVKAELRVDVAVLGVEDRVKASHPLEKVDVVNVQVEEREWRAFLSKVAQDHRAALHQACHLDV